MEIRKSVTEVARNFAYYIDRVANGGDLIVLMRGGRPVAELHPVAVGVCVRDLPELFGALPKLTVDEWDDFASDIEAGRPSAAESELRNPWDF